MNGVPVRVAITLAQQTTTVPGDDTGRTIALVIAALLGLALLLAVLTVWYWRRTDPRRRAPVEAPPAFRVEAARPGPSGPPPTGSAADRGISNEEWLRLTGVRQSGRRDHSS